MVYASETFENRTGNRMIKDHWITGHKNDRLSNGSDIQMSGLHMVTVLGELSSINFCWY
jgi:hypothetical protein